MVGVVIFTIVYYITKHIITHLLSVPNHCEIFLEGTFTTLIGGGDGEREEGGEGGSRVAALLTMLEEVLRVVFCSVCVVSIANRTSSAQQQAQCCGRLRPLFCVGQVLITYSRPNTTEHS